MKATIYWWTRSPGQMQKREFEDFYSDDFDVCLSELEENDDVSIIEIQKGERHDMVL